MTTTESQSMRIDHLISLTPKEHKTPNFHSIAEAIDIYRASVKAEIEGLKGDARSAEIAYENQKVLTRMDCERADQWKKDHDRVAAERHDFEQEVKMLRDGIPQWLSRESKTEDNLRLMTLDRDAWKADAAASEKRVDRAIEQRDGYKIQRDGAEIALSEIAKLAANPDDVVDAAFSESSCDCLGCKAMKLDR